MLKREPPLHTGRVQIGLRFWPRRSADYASWMDTYPTRRRRGWMPGVVVAGVIGMLYLAGAVLRWWVA